MCVFGGGVVFVHCQCDSARHAQASVLCIAAQCLGTLRKAATAGNGCGPVLSQVAVSHRAVIGLIFTAPCGWLLSRSGGVIGARELVCFLPD